MKNVELLRKLYPVGCKVVLHFMDDPFAPPSGTVGEVMFVDDIGQIHDDQVSDHQRDRQTGVDAALCL